MTTEPEILGPFDPEKPPKEQFDTSFEVELDDPPVEHGPKLVDVAPKGLDLLPVVPSAWRGTENIRRSLRRHGRLLGHRAAYHGVRTPVRYLPLAAVYAPRGAWRLVARTAGWWFHPELSAGFQLAVSGGDVDTALRVEARLRAARLWRGIVVCGGILPVSAAGSCAYLAAPGWAQWLLGAAAMPVLARMGRPADRRIINPAVVTPRFRRLNSDIVLRAYYAAGLGHPDKPGQKVEFGSVMSRDGDGSRVVVDLPFGTTFDDAVKAKGKIASGLDVSIYQVFLLKDRSSHRRHVLWVADEDPLAVPAGRTPLLDGKQRNIWQPFFMGLDERARRVELFLLWVSILVGAQPRKGKTFTARLMALYAALDPYVRIFVVDGKNSPDWRQFALVADRMIYGTTPNRDGDPIENLLDLLKHVKAHIVRVNELLSSLPVDMCPEGKLTEELSRDPRYPDLRVWLLVIEEFQVYFETDDQDVNKELAGLLSFIMAVGPSAGVILVSCSQKPSGVGAGDVGRLFNRYRDNHTVRIALRCGNRDVSIAVLGGDAYQEGYDASALPTGLEYRGVGYLYGATDDTPLTRFHLADREDVEVILTAARAHRERLGLLTGEAAGEAVARQIRDVLVDARGVYRGGEAWLSWSQLAGRLAERMPEHYADATPDSVSAKLRALSVPSVDGRDREDGSRVVKGAKAKDVDAAQRRRQEVSGV